MQKKGYNYWTKNETDKLKQLYNDNVAFRQISKELNRSNDSISAKTNSLINAGELKKIIDAIDTVNENDVKIDNVINYKKIIIDELKRNKFNKNKIITFSNNGQCEDAVLVLGDQHIGTINKYFDPITNKQLITYNYDIFLKQFDKLYESIISIINLLSKGYKLDTLYIYDVGDNLTNDRIYQGQPWEIEFGVGEQLMKYTTTFVKFVLNLRKIFNKIIIVKVCGNHGRSVTSHKIIEPIKNNYEYILFNSIKGIFETIDKNVEVILPNDYYTFSDIRGHRYLLMHGNTIKLQTAHSYLDLYRTARNYYIELGKYDVGICGHFHHTKKEEINENLTWLLNSSWIPKDNFALRVIKKFGKPKQWFFGVSDKRAMTWQYEIELAL